MSDAFAAALRHWPVDGVPQKPEAWLLHAARTPLMLQTVLGVEAARIREAGIPFRVPGPPEWEERIPFVLDAIYSAYTTGSGSTHAG